MSSIKYYEIESSYLFFLSKLEKRLEKDIKRGVLEKSHISYLAVGDNNYDSGTFNILYLKIKKLDGIRFERMFNKGYVLVPKRAGITLVVNGNPEDIGSLDEYLEDSHYGVNQANNVSYSTFSFTTFSYKEKTKGFINHVERYIEITHPDLEKELYPENNNDGTGTLCSGLIMGEVEDVLETRRFIINNGFGVEIKNENVVFRQDKTEYLLKDGSQDQLGCDSEENVFDLDNILSNPEDKD